MKQNSKVFLFISTVHLQILLLVGLTIFCLTLMLGCIICWKKSQICSGEDKASVTSAEASVEPVTSAQKLHCSETTTASRQLYGELDGDTLEYPSAFPSLAPSQDEFLPLQFADQAQANCEENKQTTSYFSLRRFSSPLQTTPLYKPIHPSCASSRASLPVLPKLGLLTKTCKALERRCTVAGDNRTYSEHSRLTGHMFNTAAMPENIIPLVPLNYGSNANLRQPFSSKPCLHFTMAFSSEQQTLAVTILNLSGVPQGLEDVTILGSLPPLHTCPTPATFQSRESDSLTLFVNVSSVQQLQSCELRLSVYKQKTQSAKGTPLGEVEVKCGERAWRPEHPFHLVKELTPNNLHVEEVSVSMH